MYFTDFIIKELLDIFAFTYIGHEKYNNLIYLKTNL